MKARALVMACLVVAACTRAPDTTPSTPAAVAAQAPVAAPAIPSPDDPAAHSASLAGVAEDQDAEPADLRAAATYRLPGAISASTTLMWLRQRFGEANVSIGEVPGAEGATGRGAILFAGDPNRRAYVYFQDEKDLAGLSMIRVLDAPSRWALDNGIVPGMPLAQLVARNGKAIRFSGFDWDYGGAISDWNGGRLAPRDDDPQRALVSLNHVDAADGAYPLGEDTFSSDDKRYPRMAQVVVVGEIGISFPGEDDL